MQREVAETTCNMVDEVLKKLGELLEYSNANSASRERTRRAIGSCIAELDSEILDPAYVEYPDLKPDFLKG